MNIIGKISDHKYIATVERHELLSLLDKRWDDFNIGDTIAIGKIFNIVSALRNNNEILLKQAEQLRAIACLLEPMQGIITAALKEEGESK